jgi:hypothetical protein
MRKVKMTPVLLSGLLLTGLVPVNALAAEENAYVYGTVNLTYADYYYGEINDVAINATMDLEAADKTSADSMYGYDAVTSCTTVKSEKFTQSYYEQTDSSVQIYGMKDVSVAVPKSLYDAAVKAINEGKTCNNDLLDIVKNMTVVDEKPSSYKILNGDGTLSKRQGGTVKTATGATAEITTSSRWGQYQIDVSGAELAQGQDLVGAVIETSDGSKYGLEHLDNLWLKAQEFAFAVSDGFQVPAGNAIQYKRFEDIVGKTITSITYIYADESVVIDNLNLVVKELLADNYKATATNGVYSADGKKTTVEVTVPTDSNYVLSSIKYGNTVLTDGADYTVTSKVSEGKNTYEISLNDTENVKIGTYTITYTDSKYEDISAEFQLKADMSEEDVSLVDNKLVINSDAVDVKTYIDAITSVAVNGNTVKGANGSTVFDEDGNVLLDAESNFHGTKTVLFPENGSYTLTVEASGYPTLTGTVIVGETKKEDTNEISEEPKEENPDVNSDDSNAENPVSNADENDGNKGGGKVQTGDSAPLVPLTLAATLSMLAAVAAKKRKKEQR